MIPKQNIQSNNLRDSLWESILRMEAEIKAYQDFVKFMCRESELAILAAEQMEEMELEKARA